MLNLIKITIFLLVIGGSQSSFGQSFIFGPKLGATVALQNWNGFDRQPAFLYHIAAYIESYDETSTSALYAQLGFHKRGSAERNRFINNFNQVFDQRNSYQFNNISAQFGGKRILSENGNFKPYYIIGVRGEYTLNTNLEQYTAGTLSQFAGYFPVDVFVNKFNYGFTIGGGFQRELSEHLGGAFEISINPDISKQYNQPPIPNVIDPFNVGNTRTLTEQQVRNISIEVSFVLRLLRKVEYID